MEAEFNIPEPKGLCPECLTKNIEYNQEFFWVECRHNAAIAVMEISEETGKPTGVWAIYFPVDPVYDWIRNILDLQKKR